jgi:hypothetical protein
MKSTAPAVLQQMSVPLQIAPRNLAAAFTRVPDPRRVASVTYPLVAVLSLAVTAILANQRSELAIAQWGARQPAERLRVLGLTTGRAPCQSTLQRLFCKVDGQAVAEALSAHFGPVAVPLPVVAGSQGVAFDGKAQRARYGVWMTSMPSSAKTRSNAAQYVLSLSWRRYRTGKDPSWICQTMWRACWAIQADVGCSVQPARKTRRVPRWMKKST